MNDAVELLSQLRRLGVRASTEGSTLRLRAPKGALTPELRAALAGCKDEVIAFLLAQGKTPVGGPALGRAPADADPPLSFAQQRLWFLDQLDPGRAAYNVALACALSGPLDPKILADSLGALVARHEALRTAIRLVDGQPVQVIMPARLVPLPQLDLSGLPAEQAQAEALRLAAAEGARPFDLSGDLLLRATLFRLGPGEHVLYLGLHHIACDGWSLEIVTRELMALYGALADGQAPELPPLPVRYADFAHWQRRWLQGPVLANLLGYWRGQLQGAPTLLPLPTSGPRPARPSFRGARQPLLIPPGIWGAVAAQGRARGLTPFMTVLTALDVLLFRYTGRDDILVGAPVANRSRPETWGLVGFFANTLVLRARVRGELSFAELATQVRETVLAAQAHQDLPFEHLVEELRPERDGSANPLFQVLLSLETGPTPLGFSGVRLRPLPLDPGTTKFDLTFRVAEREGALAGCIEYSADLFAPAAMERLAEHLRVLLAGVAARPEAPIRDLPLLTDAERTRLLDLAGPELPPARQAALHRAFEDQVRLTPQAEALVFDQERLTYAELNDRANRLARELVAAGVGPEVPVGLCFERCAEMVVALLAALKARGGYLPLDPTWPRARLERIIAESGAPVVVTQPALRATFAGGAGRVVCPRSAAPGTPPSPNLPGATRPESLAYVMYTSGSTGRPKGVLVPHGAVLHLVAALERAVYNRARAPLRVALNGSLAFDTSVKQIVQLLGGHVLHVLPEAIRGDARAFVRYLRDEQIDVVDCTPSQLRLLIEAGLLQLTHPLRVLVGGEAIDPALWRTLTRARRLRFFNLYGPTECTVDALAAPVTEPDSGPVIGRALSGVRPYILDARLQPVPEGVAGELYLAGPSTARGYLGQPAATAERFLPDNFAVEPGARMYRTGDLVRLRCDGAIEYLGRNDDQVKVRGGRIELHEIAATLMEHPGVSQAVVLARLAGAAHDPELVAYLVPRPGQSPAVGELIGYLRQRLPAYMVPTRVLLLDDLPLTSNSKVDRSALLALDVAAGAPVAGAAHVPPRDEREEALARIWQTVLGWPQVSVLDDFFGLGGHSLLATQVISRIRDELGVELPLRALFEAPVLADLARQIDPASPSALAAITTSPELGGEQAVSFAQQRLWLLDQLAPGSAYTIPGLVRLTGPLDAVALQRAFCDLVRRHQVLRTTFSGADGHPVAVIAPNLPVPLPVTDLSAAIDPQLELRRVARAELARPFDLGAGPLLRTRLLRLGPEDHVLVLAVHHIVADAWSIGVLVREVAALYAAHTAGVPPALLPLPIQYADFARWQRQRMADPELERQLAYWREQLAGSPSRLELPGDQIPPEPRTSRGGQRVRLFPRALLDQLRELSRREGVTLFMTLLAAWKVVLSRCAGEAADVSVGTPIAGRTRSEVEGLIGLFVNTLVLRTDLGGDPTFRELLSRVREVALGAFANQEVPFERVVQELNPQRAATGSPLFQVMFVLQNAPLVALGLSGLRASSLELEPDTAKFDLTLWLSETEAGLTAALEFSRDLFSEMAAEAWLDRYRLVLEDAVAHPERRLSRMPLLSPGEQEQLLSMSAQAGPPAPLSAPLAVLFERRAAQRPEAVALSFGSERLTYRELEARSGKLAAYLQELGVGPDVLVGLFLERSLEMVVALLAVVRAGGAYLPIDPHYPEERIRYLVEDSGVKLVLTAGTCRSRALLPGARRIELDEQAADIQRSGPLRRLQVNPGHLAYVAYTSGSTGRPKGVMVTQQAVARLVVAPNYLYICKEDVFLQYAPLSFDAATFEIWAPLLNGARLAIAPPSRLSLAELEAFVREQGVSVAWLTAPLFQAMVEGCLEFFDSVRTVLAGGDVLPVASVKRLLAAKRHIQLTNGYGPTENTTFTACYRVDPGLLARQPSVPIGSAVSHTTVHVLDRHLQPVPIGVRGELYTGGLGLARGYLGGPDLTAARFLPSPFRPGERLYRTGDLVRWLPDGRLEFLGRVDGQAKVRGFRVELGEIEAAMLEHPQVQQAAVVVRREHGATELNGYFVPRPQPGAPTLDAGRMRQHLCARLPEPLVPTALVPLSQMPLTPNGKIDRSALASRAAEASVGSRVHVAPRTPLEQALAGIWTQTLRREPVGLDDGFFELGGHSLLATQVISRVRRLLQVEVPLRRLFEAPTVRQQAEVVREIAGARERVEEVARAYLRVSQLTDKQVEQLLDQGESA